MTRTKPETQPGISTDLSKRCMKKIGFAQANILYMCSILCIVSPKALTKLPGTKLRSLWFHVQVCASVCSKLALILSVIV